MGWGSVAGVLPEESGVRSNTPGTLPEDPAFWESAFAGPPCAIASPAEPRFPPAPSPALLAGRPNASKWRWQALAPSTSRTSCHSHPPNSPRSLSCHQRITSLHPPHAPLPSLVCCSASWCLRGWGVRLRAWGHAPAGGVTRGPRWPGVGGQNRAAPTRPTLPRGNRVLFWPGLPSVAFACRRRGGSRPGGPHDSATANTRTAAGHPKRSLWGAAPHDAGHRRQRTCCGHRGRRGARRRRGSRRGRRSTQQRSDTGWRAGIGGRGSEGGGGEGSWKRQTLGDSLSAQRVLTPEMGAMSTCYASPQQGKDE